eukprot:CAMPEP_0179950080 /NCGR_PEP_ID=MMETSP0983-20121128/22727_1 /TAXON_ID=483367 /ORGANISM="non described non described, Strain CCMP 2436" /LENGTH=65 /DNA_ID=CAMNT_0021859961 /DNA_START=182 /DNA_END=379 /DNA_ORIENTATION=-
MSLAQAFPRVYGAARPASSALLTKPSVYLPHNTTIAGTFPIRACAGLCHLLTKVSYIRARFRIGE